MNKTVTSVAVVVISAFCGGCASYPFIDDSMAQLDATPVSVGTRFNLPVTPRLPIAAQSSEMLVGDWLTGFQQLVCRDVGQDGIVHNHDRKYKGCAQVYAFNADGSCAHNDILQWGGLLLQLKKYGTWSYDSGMLTLHYTKMELETQNHTAKSMGVANWKENSSRELDETVTCRVEWFAHDEIAIKTDDENDSPRTGTRKSVNIDEHGVRYEREIQVLGVKDGRETGIVSETIYPPMHLKKDLATKGAR